MEYEKNRLQILDAIRGIAVVGIYLTNILWFSGVQFAPFEDYVNQPLAQFDSITLFIIKVFVDNKFYAIFSFLFGIGFYFFLNSQNAEFDRKKLFARRLFILFIIGFIHSFFFWAGDILLIYACLGFTLLWFNKKSNQSLVINIAILFLIVIFIQPIITLLLNNLGFSKLSSASPLANQVVPNIPPQTIIDIFGHGTYYQILINNAYIWLWKMADYFFTGKIFAVLAYFLCGLYIARIYFSNNMFKRQYLFIKNKISLVAIGAVGTIISIVDVLMKDHVSNNYLLNILSHVFSLLGAIILAICYIEIVIMLTMSKTNTANYLASFGKIALSNYLSQTFFSILLFYSIGFGLTGTVSATTSLLIAIFFNLVLIIISIQWVKIFNFGPVEWIWRILTYKKYFPLLK